MSHLNFLTTQSDPRLFSEYIHCPTWRHSSCTPVLNDPAKETFDWLDNTVINGAEISSIQVYAGEAEILHAISEQSFNYLKEFYSNNSTQWHVSHYNPAILEQFLKGETGPEVYFLILYESSTKSGWAIKDISELENWNNLYQSLKNKKIQSVSTFEFNIGNSLLRAHLFGSNK